MMLMFIFSYHRQDTFLTFLFICQIFQKSDDSRRLSWSFRNFVPETESLSLPKKKLTLSCLHTIILFLLSSLSLILNFQRVPSLPTLIFSFHVFYLIFIFLVTSSSVSQVL